MQHVGCHVLSWLTDETSRSSLEVTWIQEQVCDDMTDRRGLTAKLHKA